MPTRRAEFDPIGYQFKVEIGDVTVAYFKGVDGINAERSKSSTLPVEITLRDGQVVSQDLQDWWRACRDGQYDRRTVTIVVNDNAGNEIHRWSFLGQPKQVQLNGDDATEQRAITEATFTVGRLLIG